MHAQVSTDEIVVPSSHQSPGDSRLVLLDLYNISSGIPGVVIPGTIGCGAIWGTLFRLGEGSGGPGSAGREAMVAFDNRRGSSGPYLLHYWNGDAALGVFELPNNFVRQPHEVHFGSECDRASSEEPGSFD